MMLDPAFAVRADAAAAPGECHQTSSVPKSGRNALSRRRVVLDSRGSPWSRARWDLLPRRAATCSACCSSRLRTGRIAGMEVIGDPQRLTAIEVGALGG
jgi:hypothetical protein